MSTIVPNKIIYTIKSSYESFEFEYGDMSSVINENVFYVYAWNRTIR